MSTIDSLDVDVYVQYAYRANFMEAVSEEFHLRDASQVPYHAHVVDIMPKRSEMELLLGVAGTVHMPWAYFRAPKKFRRQRRSPFTVARVAPLLGSEEKLEADLARLDSVRTSSEEEEEEKEMIRGAFHQLSKLNQMLEFIIGRIGQFLQG